eukprot:s418_g16.t1
MDDSYDVGGRGTWGASVWGQELQMLSSHRFHVYPRAFNTFVASKDAAPEDWHDKLANFNLVARVFIVNAIRNLRLHKTQDWDGLGMNSRESTFMYNHSACDEDTFAFVFPSGSDGVPELQGSFRKNQKGQYVIYVCPLTVYAENMGLLAEAVQTMVHESSHHEFAYTDDVYSCGRSHYLWLQVDGLLGLNGSACSGSLKPRYSIGGMSCNVPGHEILQLSNWTRQRYEVGLWDDHKCPANMIPIETPEECRVASELVGLDFKKDTAEENETDFPQGCYHMDIGNFEGVYFNNGNGTNGQGSQMLCQTLPTLPELLEAGNLSGCPPKYSIRRPGHGCELALPFEIAEPNMTRCPDDLAHVVKVSHCLEAGDIFGLTYGGHIASEHYPYGCFKDLQNNFITFNILEGSANSQASLVFDPRLMYTMTALRFSQDGDAALFSLQDMAFNADHCSMAYGKYKCKVLAKRNALKALLNADSFAYYASVDFADKKSGRTALHWASRQGHLEVVQWLLAEHQIPVDVRTKDDTTPFQLAAWGGHVPLCAWLLSQKADLHHRNSWFCLAHHFAALAGMSDCCKWLHQQGVDLGATNSQGHNALHKAAYGGHAALCAWLQENADLDPHQKDVRGQTCAALAKKAGFEDLSCQLSFQDRQPHKII